MRPKYAARVDETQDAIVKALRYAGIVVFDLRYPCDLLCRRGDRLYLLDCDGITKYRKRDKKQLANFDKLGVIVVPTPEAALKAVGL